MERIVRNPETRRITGLSLSQIFRLERAGKFPARRQLVPGGRATGYLLSEIDEWIKSREVAATTEVAERRIGTGKPGPGRGHKKSAANAA